MKNTFVTLTLSLVVSAVAQASDCGAEDTLFTGGESYLCQTSAGKEVCVKTGHHKTVDQDGVRVFEAEGESGLDRIDTMIFNRPSLLRCKINVFKACTHETFEIEGGIIDAYYYRAPDVWDGRSSEQRLTLDTLEGHGKFSRTSYGVNGETTFQETLRLYYCR